MKRILNKLERDEKGQTLLIVLILLVIGGLIIGPLLGFMSTGLIVGQVYEERMDELYAADSGVEDAIWKIITKAEGLPEANGETMGYSIDPVNGKEFVDDPMDPPIVITYIDDRTYKIESTATSTDTGSSTTIESYVEIPDYDFIVENVITSPNNVTIMSPSTVVGDILCDGTLEIQDGVQWTGVQSPDSVEAWPLAEELVWFYQWDVEGYDTEEDTIDIKDTQFDIDGVHIIETVNRNGELENLEIINGGKGGLEAKLTGTVYVTGDLEIATTNKSFTLHMNGQTIFVEGEIRAGTKLTLTGSGCIVAVGNIDLLPHVSSEENEFILVMSVNGYTNFQPQPGSVFNGALAGEAYVYLHPNCELTWVPPTEGLNFPWEGFTGGKVITIISTWKIILQ